MSKIAIFPRVNLTHMTWSSPSATMEKAQAQAANNNYNAPRLHGIARRPPVIFEAMIKLPKIE